MHYDKDFGVECRIARFHNIYGPYGTWKGGREKAPAAFCRKVRCPCRSTNAAQGLPWCHVLHGPLPDASATVQHGLHKEHHFVMFNSYVLCGPK